SMHNRAGRAVTSRDIGVLDGAVLVPIVAVILFLAVYPQFALHRSEGSVKGAVASAEASTRPPTIPSAGAAAAAGERVTPAPAAVASTSPAAVARIAPTERSTPRGCTRTGRFARCVVEYRTRIK